MHLLRKALQDNAIDLHCRADNLNEILRRALDVTVAQGKLAADRVELVLEALLRREQEGPTAIGQSVAVPHAYLDALEEPVITFVRLDEPLDLGAPDGIATRFVFVLIGPESAVSQHIDSLMNIARLMSDDEFRFDAARATTGDELLAALDAFEIRNEPLPEPTEEAPAIPSSLEYTGKFAGGVIADFKRRMPLYVADIEDGLHSKCVGSTLFLFFACVAPAITFGGLMSDATGSQIGAVEMLIGTAVCGVIYALFSGQPLIILGGTGPLLIFTGILYELCKQYDLPFFDVYCWVGLWSALLLVILAVTDASCWIQYFTRFTDEIFAALISIIFIVEAGKWIVQQFWTEFFGANSVEAHDKALLSVMLALGTWWMATNLSRFRRSRYLRPSVREFLADFGPSIAVVSMTAIFIWINWPDVLPSTEAGAPNPKVALDTLQVPEKLAPTTDRQWYIDPLGGKLSWGYKFAMIVPAILLTVLVYLDQNITARLVNSPDHKLHKGAAYHWDTGLAGLLIGGCSLFGVPWLVAATVRSLNHVRSLATVEEVAMRSGAVQERIVKVRENRLTPLAIHLLIALSLFLIAYLQYIPKAVLYGLFLYMGVVSMAGNQFFERLSLWLMDAELYPRTHYTHRVPKDQIHKFTFVQAACLAMLWIVKVFIGILFPLFIAALVPVRFALNRFFKEEHLDALDADEEPDDERDHYGG